ncbi:sigma-70 family RNA polymerase sigma factor [Sanguibacter antarcticus]|uniref:sigma-70 family RNA polymerase sigma factor n=1 Tax=Sanguibacter antarcticus TaxID=372484 RepID=UPI001B804704|nr:sigma-70 family RNA polymerase sigma factor [Sanguibacter antarcticus]
MNHPDTATVVAARAGDPQAVDRLVTEYLPLVYTIVGRALDGHADVDDVVQETMMRVVRNLGDLQEPESFRSWLVAITVRQVRERYRARRDAPRAVVPDDVRQAGSDFTDLAIVRLELSGQRRETAEATRWLDEEARELLALWWLEASGHLTRDEIVATTAVNRQHTAVRIQRMKEQLETSRVVVRALATSPRCPDLILATTHWDGSPSPLWRKRIARHTRECERCTPAWSGLVSAERLLGGMALVPPSLTVSAGLAHLGGDPVAAAQTGTAASTGTAHPAPGAVITGRSFVAGITTGRRVLTTLLVTGMVLGGGAVAVGYQNDQEASAPVIVPTAARSTTVSTPSLSEASRKPQPAPTPTTDDPTPSPSSQPAAPEPTASPTPAPAPAPAPAPTTTTSPTAAAVLPATLSVKKGVATWQFDGIEGALGDVGAGWYYNWSPSNATMPGPADVEFVPMIWGRDDVDAATLAQVASEGTVLLGFNEPDMGGQANMGVEEALDLWPQLESTGMRLGSPAVAYGGDTPGGWLDTFMTGAAERNLRVDFITLHWYGSDFSDASVGHFLSYVDAVHERYGLPVWITEYGLMNFSGSPKYPTGAQAAAFIEGSTTGMESRAFVERYAWFGLPAVGDSVEFGLYRDATTPTEAGLAYKAAG